MEKLNEGMSLSDLQTILTKEYNQRMTYFELRMLAAQLKVDWEKRDRPKPKPKADPIPPQPTPPPQEETPLPEEEVEPELLKDMTVEIKLVVREVTVLSKSGTIWEPLT